MALSDWNALKNGGAFTLTTVQKKEGLRSLQIESIYDDEGILALKQSETDKPKNANVIFWWRAYSTAATCKTAIFARIQDINNFYALALLAYSSTQSQAAFVKKVAGNYEVQGYIPFTNAPLTWNRLKVQFCEVAGALHAVLFREVSGVFTQVLTFSYSPALWPDGGAVGVGFINDYNYGNIAYLDTTLIYY